MVDFNNYQAFTESYIMDPPVTVSNPYGENRFLAACQEGNIPAIKWYKECKKVDVNALVTSRKYGGEVTALTATALEHNECAVRYLLQQGANPLIKCFGDENLTAWECVMARKPRNFISKVSPKKYKERATYTRIIGVVREGHTRLHSKSCDLSIRSLYRPKHITSVNWFVRFYR